MNNQKVVLYIVLAVVLLGLGGFVFTRNPSDKQMVAIPTPVLEVAPTENSTMQIKPSEDTSMMVTPAEENTSKMVDKTPKMMAGSEQRYTEYSNDVINSSSGKRRVLFFYANWCPTCKPADADFTKNSTMIPEDVELIRVNYNDPDTDPAEKELANKYGITYQHTFVQIDANGNVVTKWNGGQIKELVMNIK
ncbi:MAG: thioredoxin domain-containing protein [Candidatus Shapirobacteria bacterium]|jgi:thiol-disulfide isomerase/thioredoxin